MHWNLLRGVPGTVLFLLTWSAVAPCACPAQGGAPLRHRWPAGAGVDYAVEVTADSPSAVESYKGRIAYTLAGQEGDVLKVTFNGGRTKTEKAKRRPGDDDPRFFGPFGRMPGPPMSPFAQNPFPGVGRAKNELQMTGRGHIRSLEGNSQLPWLLGHLSLLILEPF